MEETKLQRILMELRTDLDMLLERYYSGATKEMQEKLSSLSTLVTELQTKVETLDSDNTTNKTDIESIKADIVNIKSKCEEFTTNIANLQSSVTQNTSDITDLTTRVTTAETDIDDLQTLTASHTETLNDHWDKMMLLLAEAISMTTKMSNAEERITALENSSATGNPEISKADITALQTQVDALETEVDSLTTKVTTNTTNIADLTSRVNTNTTNIATNTADIVLLKTTTENITSTVSELQTTVATNTQNISNLQSTISTNTTNIQTNTDNISALQSQVNTNTENIATTTANIATNTANIATNTTNIATLMAFRDSLLTPPDPYYNPKTFSDYPAGTILQGYAKFSRKYDLVMNTLKTPTVLFTAELGSSGKIFFRIKFSSTITFNGTINLYQNGNLVYQEQYSFNNTSKEFDLERTVNGLTLQQSNLFYLQINSNNTLQYTLTFYELQLLAPNAEIVNSISPFNVEYFENKYYISDCSSGIAKIAEINVTDMHNMDNLSWTNTEIECLTYKTTFDTKKFADTYAPNKRIDYYQKADTKIYFENKSNNEISNTQEFCNLDWIPVNESITYFTAIFKKSFALTNATYFTMFNYVNSTNKPYYFTTGARYLQPYNDFVSRRFIIYTKETGENFIKRLDSYTNFSLNIGLGTNVHFYYKSYNDDIILFDCYMKYYDKIIKKTISFTNTNGFSITSSTEIGAYEEYFEGANNDYFVVKAGKLEYHKKQ